jgi:hypothetical protein
MKNEITSLIEYIHTHIIHADNLPNNDFITKQKQQCVDMIDALEKVSLSK